MLTFAPSGAAMTPPAPNAAASSAPAAVKRTIALGWVLSASVALLVGLASQVATSALYFSGGLLAIHGVITLGTVILFASYADRVVFLVDGRVNGELIGVGADDIAARMTQLEAVPC